RRDQRLGGCAHQGGQDRQCPGQALVAEIGVQAPQARQERQLRRRGAGCRGAAALVCFSHEGRILRFAPARAGTVCHGACPAVCNIAIPYPSASICPVRLPMTTEERSLAPSDAAAWKSAARLSRRGATLALAGSCALPALAQ